MGPMVRAVRTATLVLSGALLVLAGLAGADQPPTTDVAVPAAVQPEPPPVSASGKKWGPHVDTGIKADDDRQIGLGDIFLPLWQDDDSLAFLDLRVSGDDSDSIEGNIGAAYRSFVGDDWILGGYGFFDIRSSDAFGSRNTFIGGTLGVEAMSETWDLRTNVYIPEDDAKSAPTATTGSFSGGTIVVNTGEERALYGFDAEVGARLPFFGEDSAFWDTRLFAGGYYFDAKHIGGFGGPRGRFESRIYDIPFVSDLLGEGTRLTFAAEVMWDDERNITSYGGVKLRIPLYGWFGGGQGSGPGGKLTKLERRMTDPIVRDVDINTFAADSGKENALNPKNRERIGDAVFASANGNGGAEGTQQDPLDLFNATWSMGFNGVVAVLGDDGPIQEGGMFVSEGGIVAGSGSSFFVIGEGSGQWVSVKVPGKQRAVIDNPNADYAFSMSPYSYITGLDILGGTGGILAELDDWAMVSHVNFEGTGTTGLQVLSSQNFSAEELRFRNFDDTNAFGAFVSGSPNFELSGAYFENIGGNSTIEAFALNLFNSSDSKLRNIVVNGVTGIDSAAGVNIGNSSRTRVKGLDVSNVGGADFNYGFLLQNSSDSKARDVQIDNVFGVQFSYGAFIQSSSRFRGLNWRIADIGSGDEAFGLRVDTSSDTKFKEGFSISGINGFNATGLQYNNSSNPTFKGGLNVANIFGSDYAGGVEFNNSFGLRGFDWNINNIQGDRARGAYIQSDEAFLLGLAVSDIFGQSSATGLQIQDSSNVIGKNFGVEDVFANDEAFGYRFDNSSFTLGFDWLAEDIQAGNTARGFEFSALNDSLLIDIKSEDIRGGNTGSGFRLFDSSNITVKGLDVDGVSGDDALGAGVSFASNINGLFWNIMNIEGGNSSFGTFYDFVDDSKFKKTTVSGIRGQNAWGVNFDFGSFLDVRDFEIRDVEGSNVAFGLNLGSVNNLWGMRLNVDGVRGAEAFGVAVQDSPNVQTEDVEVKNVEGLDLGVGLRVSLAANWLGQNWNIDRVSGNDAWGADVGDADNGFITNWKISNIKAFDGSAYGFRLGASFNYRAENWSVNNVEGTDEATGWDVQSSFQFIDDWKISNVLSAGVSRGYREVDSSSELFNGSISNIGGGTRSVGFKSVDSSQTEVDRLAVNNIFGDSASGFRLDMSQMFMIRFADLSNVKGQTEAWGYQIDNSDDFYGADGTINGVSADGVWGIGLGNSVDALFERYSISGINAANEADGITVHSGSNGASFLDVDINGVKGDGNGFGFVVLDSGINGNPVTFDMGSIRNADSFAVRVQNSWLDGDDNDLSGNDPNDCEDLGGNNGQLIFAQITCNF